MENHKKELITKIKQSVYELDPKAEVILFGSQARGEENDTSDWDILILIDENVDLQLESKYRHKLFDLELEYGKPISTFVYSKTEWHGRQKQTPLYQNIQKDGVKL